LKFWPSSFTPVIVMGYELSIGDGSAHMTVDTYGKKFFPHPPALS
jgi:hypothetical protein